MEFTYKPNPLETTVELNEQEQALLWHKLRIKQLEEISYSAYFALKKSYLPGGNQEEAVQEALEALDPKFIYGKKIGERSALDEEVDSRLQESLAELKLSHAGDCTAFPAGCGKCAVEDLLGINTIPGLGKFSANLIHNTFSTYNPETEKFDLPTKTLKEVIAILSAHDSSYSPSMQESMQRASEWLVKYAEQHPELTEEKENG